MWGTGRALGLLAASVLALVVQGHARAQQAPGARLEVRFDESALEPKQRLGMQIFFDARLSEPAGVSCASCHDPARAFTGNNASTLGVALGSRAGTFGFRDTPTLMYLATTPPFGFVDKDGKRIPAGGMFWDGRAATFEEQARQPLFNPVEMNNASPAALVAKVAAGPYAEAFRGVFGARIFDDAAKALDALTEALAAFQRTRAFQPFSSKFDAVMRGEARFTEQEQRGLSLFTIRQKGNCASCHIVNESAREPRASLFTDFSYHALGVPRSARIPRNADQAYRDLGLCGPFRDDAVAKDQRCCGYFKAPTLPNIALTAPYMHNGVFDSLRDAVAFYATRDTDPRAWYPQGRKFDDLAPEHHANVDVDTPPYQRQPGRRAQLSDADVDDIVAFLHTLTDGYRPDQTGAERR